MNLSILSITKETDDSDYKSLGYNIINEMETYSGKLAGICYMKDKYFDSYVSDANKAKARFERVAPTGHHSISDHCFITVLFENIPKMTAMILNSIGFYNTSEKSGRYTVMSSENSEYSLNEELYHKWVEIFKKLIKEYDSGIEDKLVEKLSLENARYMISVFATSTTMAYTTSLRMWSYIRQFCKRYIDVWNDDGASLDLVRTPFNKKVLECIKDLYNSLTLANLYSDHIVDNKARNFQFLAKQTGYNIWNATESYSDSYLIKYKSSFASLAQEHRHRTLNYYMCFDGSQAINFYIPKLIRETEYKQIWLEDLEKVKESYPIATLVDVVETGTITDFLFKCDERLCGRVQLETMENIIVNLLKFGRDWNKSPFMISQLQKHIRDGKIIMKCGNIKCEEPCYWGPIKAQNRLV